jgi:hypothetical protein
LFSEERIEKKKEMYFFADKFPVKSFLAVPTGQEILEVPIAGEEDEAYKAEGDPQSRGASIELIAEVRAVEDAGRAAAEDVGRATAEDRGRATAEDGGRATAEDGGRAAVEDGGRATSRPDETPMEIICECNVI